MSPNDLAAEDPNDFVAEIGWQLEGRELGQGISPQLMMLSTTARPTIVGSNSIELPFGGASGLHRPVIS